MPKTEDIADDKEVGVGTLGAQMLLPAIARGVPLSRQLVREICHLLDLGDIADLAELLASEVVTNAVLHARTRYVQVVVGFERGQLKVSVADDDLRRPTLARLGTEATSGRGLYLLDALATDWGVTAWPNGKAVWFVLDAGQRERPAPGALPDRQIDIDVEPGAQ